MHIVIIYLVALVSLVLLMVLWKVRLVMDTHTRNKLLSYARKKILYTIVFQRPASSDKVSVYSVLNIFLFLAANVAACTLGLSNRVELAKRCGTLFLINLVPIVLGGKMSLVADQILRMQLSESSLIHRWMGRICIIQGLIHGIMNTTFDSPTSTHIALFSLLGTILCLSFFYIRRFMYEIFVKSHIFSTLGLLVLLWFHIPLTDKQAVIFLGTANGLWLVQQTMWLARLIYRNSGKESSKAICTAYSGLDSLSQVMGVTIKLQKPWVVRPGQYVYLTLPSVHLSHAGFAQSHPYVIAWVDGSDITLLVQRCRGFSSDLFTSPHLCHSAVIDGPYGHSPQLNEYDKVLLIASGIGVASHFLAIRELLDAHEKQQARIRRITLVWFVETADQIDWAKQFLRRLLDMDLRRVFTLALYVPAQVKMFKSDNHQHSERLLQTDQSLELGWYIDKENLAEAGNMAILVCGTPHFEQSVSRAVNSSKHNIYLFFAGFHPEETVAGQVAQSRYT